VHTGRVCVRVVSAAVDPHPGKKGRPAISTTYAISSGSGMVFSGHPKESSVRRIQRGTEIVSVSRTAEYGGIGSRSSNDGLRWSIRVQQVPCGLPSNGEARIVDRGRVTVDYAEVSLRVNAQGGIEQVLAQREDVEVLFDGRG
jgi:hypothetical protein